MGVAEESSGDRRLRDRVALGLSAPVAVTLATTVVGLSGVLREVSLGGARIALDEPPDRIEADVPASLWLGAVAVAVTIRHIDVSRPWEPSCGVRFTDEPAAVAEFLAAVATSRR